MRERLGGVFSFDKTKQNQAKLKQDLVKREDGIKGGEGLEREVRVRVLDACMHQARPSMKRGRDMGDDPLKDSNQNQKTRMWWFLHGPCKTINAMLNLVKTIIFTWHYSYAFPNVGLSQAKE